MITDVDDISQDHLEPCCTNPENMVRITEDLIRKRSEHNECIISTLEEISLHQQDLERIEHLDRWCRDLKILYLQSNLIPKIENVGRLKKLEYLNLALNNIELIENLEGCESLKKLDLTVNFVGELTSIESLKGLFSFRELFLTGNPCAQFEGYRQYVLATLPQLRWLDGIEIDKSERLLADQALFEVRPLILQQQESYRKKRLREKAEELQKDENETKKSKPVDGSTWYTNTDSDSQITKDQDAVNNREKEIKKTEEEKEKEFWEEKVPFTPESRVRVHEHMKKTKEKKGKSDVEPLKKERTLIGPDGKIYNVNEAKVEFSLTEDTKQNCLLLDVAVFRHMDTALCDVDVQPTHVKVTMKGKVLQLVLPEEVQADCSTAKRSQITGHLLLTMPKVEQLLQPHKQQERPQAKTNKEANNENHGDCQDKNKPQTLEVDPNIGRRVDLSNIVRDKNSNPAPMLGQTTGPRNAQERPNSEDFVDNPDVPPLM